MRADFLVAGDLATISGGYGYDRAIIAGLRGLGHTVSVAEIAGRHPLADEPARHAAEAAWHAMPPGGVPLIDGLGLPAFAPLADSLVARNAVGLIHHPTCLEAGLPDAEAAALRDIECALFPRLRRCLVTSETTAKTLAADFAVDPERITVVVPGTEPAARSPGSGGATCEILAIGSLIPRKGHDLLLTALSKLFDLDWRLTIAGGPLDSPLGQSLQSLSQTLGIERRVSFAGTATDRPLDRLWRQADLFALATWYEGYGMAIAEALARGLPVVVTDGGAAGQLVTPEAGAVCPVGDVVTLSKTLRRLIFDTELREEMAGHAWAIGRTLPDWPAQAAAFARALAG